MQAAPRHSAASDFLADGRGALALAKTARDAFVALADATDYTSVVTAFDRIRAPLDPIRGFASLLQHTHPGAEHREAGRTLEQEIAAFETELALDRAVYERLARLASLAAPTPEEGRLVERALKDFRRSGVDKDDATRKRIAALADEIVVLGQTFETNVIQDSRTLTIADGKRGLAGLPDDYVAAHAEDGHGAVRVTTDPSDYVPFMTYADRGDLREALWRLNATRAVPANVDLLKQILIRRAELARLVGFENYAELSLDDKMVGGARQAREFIERVAALAKPRALAELAELLALKREATGSADSVRDFERFYWIERAKEERFGFDSQLVRPYLAYHNVRDGVLATSQLVFGLEFRRDDAAERWHPSVECYDVFDHGRKVARFWLDMHSRKDKYKHAAMFPLCSGIAGERLPEAALVCNFPEPRGDDPGLMLHSELTTFFHEFGHLMHHLLGGRTRFLCHSGVATEMDFVEVPSQLYEEWAWNTGVLQRFARHHATGEPIPAELVQQIREAEEYGKALHVIVQMYYAALALEYHTREPASLDLCATMIEQKQKFTPFPYEVGTHFYASFGHLVGYAAAYYTYMWSLVIAKDLFGAFGSELGASDVAARYRRHVLEPGGSKDARELVKDFLGRDYAFAAWQRWLES
ncbi:MAG: Zn-dependent oligopeptidase [Planctomycetes bacterium]|nr:Zn-dependent oligopeptidase [Planctomycetota bacterium]